ncbi:MAG: M4 family metallopeptidase [Chitinophagaceae bacterium]|nr:M4 family metallopeptidase [Chitinophagaceae bacterium]
MKIQLLISIFLISVGELFAQDLDYFKVSENWYELKKERKPATKIETVKTTIKKDFKIRVNEDFIKDSESTDNSGNVHLRYKHFIDGIPVIGSEYLIHKKVNSDYVDLLSTKIFTNIKIKKAKLSEGEALAVAIKYLPATKYYWQVKYLEDEIKEETANTEATYYPKGKLVYGPSDKKEIKSENYELCYTFIINAKEPFFSKEIYVSTITGEIIRVKDLIIKCNTQANATTLYYGNRIITTDWIGWPINRFRLQECNRNIHKKYGYGLNPEAKNSTTSWGANEQLATSAHWAAEMTWDLYWFTYGRRGTDNLGRQIKVHADDPTATSFAGAFYNFSGGGNDKIHIGNSAQGQSCATLDVIGHEITHGLVNATSALEYQNEPGALNESFADIFGLMTERRGLNGLFNWRIGELAWPGTNGIRSFDNPNVFAHPSIFDGLFWFTGTDDNGGVHINSSVQNHWFFLLSNGGFQNGIAVTGIGVDNAARIAWNNLIFFLGNWSNYNDARNGSINAAIGLFGECSNEVQQVRNAWAAVGVGNPANPNCITLNSAWFRICHDEPWPQSNFPITITANFTPVNGIITWDIPPVFTFITSGNTAIITDGPVTPDVMLPISATLTSSVGNPVTATTWYTTVQCYGDVLKVAKSNDLLTIEKFSEPKINIFPNPAADIINVSMQSYGNIKILDLNGRVLFNRYAPLGLTQINTMNLKNGTYMISITNGLQSKSYKIIVVH